MSGAPMTKLEQDCKPKHCWGVEQFGLFWFLHQQAAFCQAMRDNPDERPSEMEFRRKAALVTGLAAGRVM